MTRIGSVGPPPISDLLPYSNVKRVAGMTRRGYGTAPSRTEATDQLDGSWARVKWSDVSVDNTGNWTAAQVNQNRTGYDAHGNNAAPNPDLAPDV